MALISTTRGEMDESLLTKREGDGWVEYYLGTELVHRSATARVVGVSMASSVMNQSKGRN